MNKKYNIAPCCPEMDIKFILAETNKKQVGKMTCKSCKYEISIERYSHKEVTEIELINLWTTSNLI